MTEDHDPYAVLGVTPVATQAEINHAFRVKVRDLHPDTRHPRAGGMAGESQLEQLIAAYRLLRDPERRARHDRNVTAATAPSRNVAAIPVGPLTILVTHGSQPAAATHLRGLARCAIIGDHRRIREYDGPSDDAVAQVVTPGGSKLARP